VLNDQNTQLLLAGKVMDYLNSVLDAQAKAIEGDALFQKIML